MKTKKWLSFTAVALLTLVVLAVVGGAGFRAGMMQNTSFTRLAFAHNFDNGRQFMQGNTQPQTAKGNTDDNNAPLMQGNFQGNGGPRMQGNFQGNDGPQGMQGNSRNQGFDRHGNDRGNDRRDGGRGFFSPIFGLIHLVILGLLVWVVYKLVKESGWRITRVSATPAPAAPSVDVEENK
jgi:hypothetical protein